MFCNYVCFALCLAHGAAIELIFGQYVMGSKWQQGKKALGYGHSKRDNRLG